MATPLFNHTQHPIGDPAYARSCGAQLHATGALVLANFFPAELVAQILDESAHRESEAFYAASSHNVYLTPLDTDAPADHPLNRQVTSSKGLIADDQIAPDSPLREIYENGAFRAFLCGVLAIDEIFPYADNLSSINVHYASEGMELGWHFDNSSFAVTMLLQAPEAGGVFEYVPAVRDAASDDIVSSRIADVLDGVEPVSTLHFEPGDLVVFRGREALHRVTPTKGSVTRMLVVFAFNDQPAVGLSESALTTFYGRTN